MHSVASWNICRLWRIFQTYNLSPLGTVHTRPNFASLIPIFLRFSGSPTLFSCHSLPLDRLISIRLGSTCLFPLSRKIFHIKFLHWFCWQNVRILRCISLFLLLRWFCLWSIVTVENQDTFQASRCNLCIQGCQASSLFCGHCQDVLFAAATPLRSLENMFLSVCLQSILLTSWAHSQRGRKQVNDSSEDNTFTKVYNCSHPVLSTLQCLSQLLPSSSHMLCQP